MAPQKATCACQRLADIAQRGPAPTTANMSWACDRCTLEQSDRRRACGACGNLRPDLLRACFPDVKTQKRSKGGAANAFGGAKGGAANPRGVWSNLPLTCGMVSLPRRPRAVANPCHPQLQVPQRPSESLQ